jgi:hypothetical protein
MEISIINEFLQSELVRSASIHFRTLQLSKHRKQVSSVKFKLTLSSRPPSICVNHATNLGFTKDSDGYFISYNVMDVQQKKA